ncbi:hypothetical protein TNCV_4232651 [Trichonephila clavipes]|nr:hypothetical protein TNCV_4232651 [Trichonephila clavipes]
MNIVARLQPCLGLWPAFSSLQKRFCTLEITFWETPVVSATLACVCPPLIDYQLSKLLIRLTDFDETSHSSKQRTY